MVECSKRLLKAEQRGTFSKQVTRNSGPSDQAPSGPQSGGERVLHCYTVPGWWRVEALEEWGGLSNDQPDHTVPDKAG